MHPMSRELLLVFLLSAQWLGRRAEDIPRLANGQPDLSAPAPKTADSKPDLSGTWKLDQDRLGVPKVSNFQTYVAALANRAPFRPGAAALQRAARENNYKELLRKEGWIAAGKEFQSRGGHSPNTTTDARS